MKRIWVGVRASAPAVQSTVFNMRSRAAAAREVVERRHRIQAADLIRLALRVSPQALAVRETVVERLVLCMVSWRCVRHHNCKIALNVLLEEKSLY